MGGKSQQELGEENYRRVREYFRTHLCATQRECSEALGLSIMAVNRHVARIRDGWRLVHCRVLSHAGVGSLCRREGPLATPGGYGSVTCPDCRTIMQSLGVSG